MSATSSYSSGESEKPLLGDTIGGNFDVTVRRFGDRDALVDRPAGRRWTYAEPAPEADRICIPVPFYHCFGMVMGNLAATSHGACMVIPAPAFDPAATLEAVQAERCTSLYGVPTMFIAELSLDRFADYDLSSLRTGIMAGPPC